MEKGSEKDLKFSYIQTIDIILVMLTCRQWLAVGIEK